MTKLLTFTNPKLNKGLTFGWFTAVMHFAPFKLSGFNVCRAATAWCIRLCLNTAGHGGIGIKAPGDTNSVQEARIRRTRSFFEDRDGFLVRLAAEITTHVRRCDKLGYSAAIRLNGTSDLDWERIRHSDGWSVLERFPAVTFYDYTKVTGRHALPANYSLTFSLAENNDSAALAELETGRNVAVVFETPKGHALPAEYLGRPVIDGDISDLRFKDPVGVVVGLRAKGKAIGTGSHLGFVRLDPASYAAETVTLEPAEYLARLAETWPAAAPAGLELATV